MCGYPAMMPDPELDFMLPTVISIAMCYRDDKGAFHPASHEVTAKALRSLVSVCFESEQKIFNALTLFPSPSMAGSK